MSLQTSTFSTAHVLDNEIIKANDFEFAFEQIAENVSKATQMFLESTQDFVINGKVLPYSGMNIRVSPIYGVCKSTGIPFGRTETTDETIGFEGSSSGRIDILEVQGDWETYDNQQRAFNDPDTDTQTYQYVDTKKLMKPVYRVKKGIEGAGVAPDVDTGWVKLAEVSIRAGVTTILASDIHNITADVAGLPNEDWTNEEDITYNIGYISDINARFREQHNEDGTHKDDCINSDALDIGTGTKQINGNILPFGGAVSIPTQTIASTDSILSVIVKAASMITSLYNGYLQYGVYGYKGEVKISSILDANNELSKPISISAAGDGTAVIKIDDNAVLSVDANGKLSTNGYTASSNNHIVTKIVTDGLKALIDALDVRVTNIENTSDVTVYANGTLSTGTNGRYNIDDTVIYAATTQNITLSGSQTIDGTTPVDGSIILVKDQTNAKENGIYQYSSNSLWTRVNGFLSPNALKAKIFNVVNGTLNGGKMYYLPKVNFTDGESFGTDDISFLEFMGTISVVGNRVVVRDKNGNIRATTFYGNLTGTASNADTLNGYASSDADVANTIGRRTAGGYFNAVIFHDNWTEENINSYSNPKIMFKGNGDGYIRNTSPSNVSVGYATSAGSASSAGYATSAGNADTVDSYHASGEYDNTLFRALKSRDSGVVGCGYWGGMASVNVDGEPKWWHVLSMDWTGGTIDSTDWVSQFLLPTQQGGIPKYRFNANGGGTAISVSPWKNFITQDNIGSQSVNYATSAGSASSAGSATSAGYATSAGNADTVDGYHVGATAGHLIPVTQQWMNGNNGYIVFASGLIIQWGYWEGSGRDYETISLHLGYSSIDSYGAYVTAVVNNSSYGNYSTIAKRSASTIELATWNGIDSHRNGIRAQWFTIGY